MTIKVKGTPKLEPKGELVRVTVETPEGKEYGFTAKLEHVLDEVIFKSLLHAWDRMVKEKEAQAELKTKDIEKILKKRAKMETKD